MKLFYAPGACSLSPHIVAKEAGISLQLEKVDLGTKRLQDGTDFAAVNPKGYVPALMLEDGTVLTEGVAVVQYLADLKPASELAPAPGSLARYRLQEMLTYISSELHKNFAPLFSPTTPASLREEKITTLKRRYDLIDKRLQGKSFLIGERFTAADAYLFTVTNWARMLELDLSEFHNLMEFQERVALRPAVRTALQAEGLLH